MANAEARWHSASSPRSWSARSGSSAYNIVGTGGSGDGRRASGDKQVVDPAAPAAGDGRRRRDGRARRARHPGRGVKPQRTGRYLHPGARRRRRASMTRSTSWRRWAARWSPPRRARVEKLFFSKGGGGITVYVRSRRRPLDLLLRPSAAPMRRACARASASRAARSIGFVGYTGNANPAGPHLHFAINRMEPGEKWYQGSADQSLSAACRKAGQPLGRVAVGRSSAPSRLFQHP